MEAVGLASSIITFIEAGFKVYGCYSEIRASTSGATAINEHIETITRDLKAAVQPLENAKSDQSDNALYTLAKNCGEVSKELIELLEDLRPSKPGRLHAFAKSIKAYWREDAIRRLDERLMGYRQELALRLQILMVDPQSTWKSEVDEIKQIGNQYFNPYSYHLQVTESELQSIVGSISSEDTRTLTDRDMEHSQLKSSSAHLQDKLLEFHSLAQLVSKQNRVLRKLYFNSLQLREDQIGTPEADTCQWLLKDLSGREADSDARSEFQQTRISRELVDFLRRSRRILFINGKAGCGKSTVMKFLSKNEQVADALKVWADKRKLVLVKMFFWRSEDLFLKSRRGFYRAVLFHIIRQCPELLDTIFPSEKESFMDAVEFPIEELEEAVRRLAKVQHGKTHCFCYFIDGLDEYEGDATDQEIFAQQLVDWTLTAEVKIICSSRPNPIFQEVFKRISTMVNLHEFNAPDIERFARHRFNTILSKVEHSAAREACVDLVDIIVQRAEGVFLWASLVVRSLLNASLLHEEPSRLGKILDDSPTDLNDFFAKILQRMDPSPWSQRRSTALLYMTIRNPYPDALNALAVSWLDEMNWLADPDFQDDDFPLNRTPREYSDGDIVTKLATAKVLLQACTQGLVEFREHEDPKSPSFFRYRLEFFHRSVREYLNEQWLPSVRARSRPPLPLPLQEVEFFARLRCAEAKFCSLGKDQTTTSIHVRYMWESTFFSFSRLTVKKGKQPPLKCLQDLERGIHGGSLQIQLDGDKFVKMQLTGPLKAFLGTLKIEKDHSWRWHHRMDDGCSFTHWAAYWGQRDYVTHQLRGIEHHVRAAEGVGMNLLLTAALATDTVLCRHLLSHGWTWDDRIKIAAPRQSAPDDVPIWLVILRDFAYNLLAFLKCRRENVSFPEHMDAGWLERWAAVIELFLAAGACPRMDFVLGFGRSNRFFAASLEMLLDVLKAPNWASLVKYFKESPDNGAPATSPLVAGTAPTSGGYLAPGAPPKSCTTEMLLKDSWDVAGVQEPGSPRRLFGTFIVRVF